MDEARWWEAATPREWLDRLGRAVTVELRGGGAREAIEGYLHAIDPELHHLMILRPLPPASNHDEGHSQRVRPLCPFILDYDSHFNLNN
jgi:hypothetical protein